MARKQELAIDVGGMKSAIIRKDGSLIIASRKTLSDFTENDWDVVVISPTGVKNLMNLLVRDAQQQDEAIGELADKTPKSLSTED